MSRYEFALLRKDGSLHPTLRLRPPSVTEILDCLPKPQLVAWKERMGEEESERVGKEARDRGTAVHSYMEALAVGDVPDPANGYQEAGLNWWFDAERTVTACEEPVIHRYPLYMGTLDLIDGRTLVDFKTSKRFHGEMALQVEAYRHAWHDMGNPLIDRLLVVLLRPNGTFEEVEVTDTATAWGGFLHALDLYLAQRLTPLDSRDTVPVEVRQ